MTTEETRLLYDRINNHLGSIPDGQGLVHLNYGYAAIAGVPRRAVTECDLDLSADLVLEVIGDCPLDGRDVLDVGCGRGGSVRIVCAFYPGVKTITGLDLSPAAVTFCRSHLSQPNVRFLIGDAQAMPVPDAAADVVINIESACCYPEPHAFYREVWRVLRPRGRFLYADSFATPQVEPRLSYLQSLGFCLQDRRDITANVIQACDRIAEERVRRVRRPGPQRAGDESLANRICAPGSRKYDDYAEGREKYVIFDLLKREERAE